MIAIVAGTNRPGSNSRKVAQQVVEFYSEAGVVTELIDLANWGLQASWRS